MQASENNSAESTVNKGDLEVNDSNGRVYELGFLLLPTIAEENVPATMGDLKELISTFGGTILSDDMPRMIPLAYSMTKVIQNIRTKFNTAYFGWVKFEMDSQKVVEMKAKLNFEPNLLRFLITKTVKENTIAARRFVQRDGVHRRPSAKKEEGGEPAPEINKEEIDKEIEAMVAA